MAETSTIEWTDATWNPIRAKRMVRVGDALVTKVGWHCEHKSEGCRFCYAERQNRGMFGNGMDYKPGNLRARGGSVDLFLDETMLLKPLRWKKARRIFVCSMTDMFADFVPDEWIDRMFAVMALCPQHTFQVLTKRPERMRGYLNAAYTDDLDRNLGARWCRATKALGFTAGRAPPFPLPNVWLGVSVEDQAAADERVPLLLQTPAAVRFLSCEPLLGPVDIAWAVGLRIEIAEGFLRRGHFAPGLETLRKLDWVIVGGESGPNARPMHPDWARSLRDQCAAAGVSFFFKQWGEWAPLDALRLDGARAGTDGPVMSKRGNVRDWMNRYVTFENDAGALRLRGHSFTEHSTDLVYRIGKKRAGRLLDGELHDGFPGVRA